MKIKMKTILESFEQVKIEVIDKNDSPPVFGEDKLVISVSEDLLIGHQVATLGAADGDLPAGLAEAGGAEAASDLGTGKWPFYVQKMAFLAHRIATY